MANTAILQVRMDAALKEEAEELYSRMGTSLVEAVRIFARQSVMEQAMPFQIHAVAQQEDTHRRIGIAKGKLVVPDDIDKYNDEIEELFEQ